MKIRSSISTLLVFVLLWNTGGWLFIGLIQAGTHHHDDEKAHCRISFCYCEVSEAETICTCHHSELHGATASSGNQHGVHDSRAHDHQQTSICFFTKPDKEPDRPTLAFADHLRTILTPAVDLSVSESPAEFGSTYLSLLSGVTYDLLRPPSA